MQRRTFVTGMAAVVAAPLAAEAQQVGRTARVRLLIPTVPMPASATPNLGLTRDLPRRLAELGWMEGANVVICLRSSLGALSLSIHSLDPAHRSVLPSRPPCVGRRP